jgi:toxin FitB
VLPPGVDAELLFMSPVVVAELELGVLLMERQDAIQGALLRSWVNGVAAEFRDRCVPIGMETARAFAALHVPNKRPERDAWIAATAICSGLTVVTRNVADFAPMDVPVLNPWRGG